MKFLRWGMTVLVVSRSCLRSERNLSGPTGALGRGQGCPALAGSKDSVLLCPPGSQKEVTLTHIAQVELPVAGRASSAALRGRPGHRMCLAQIFDPPKPPTAELGAVIPQGL